MEKNRTRNIKVVQFKYQAVKFNREKSRHTLTSTHIHTDIWEAQSCIGSVHLAWCTLNHKQHTAIIESTNKSHLYFLNIMLFIRLCRCVIVIVVGFFFSFVFVLIVWFAVCFRHIYLFIYRKRQYTRSNARLVVLLLFQLLCYYF